MKWLLIFHILSEMTSSCERRKHSSQMITKNVDNADIMTQLRQVSCMFVKQTQPATYQTHKRHQKNLPDMYNHDYHRGHDDYIMHHSGTDQASSSL